jgi:hypothetical protein
MAWSDGSGSKTPLVNNMLAGSIVHHHAASKSSAGRRVRIACSR